jgi:Arc/MetJ-type ribon-helix-helix transcriptional regulator
MTMPTAKVAVSIDAQLLREVDSWVAAGDFPSRSQAVQAALHQLRSERARRGVLLRELAHLDPVAEQQLAEEWLGGETSWPEY